MLEQVGDDFEVLVVDDASTDNSVDILDSLSDQYTNLRYVELPDDDQRKLGETRNRSVQEARGEYVLLQLDADDKYDTGIESFTQVYDVLASGFDEPFYLKGDGINMAPRSFLLERGPYRNLPVGGEDRDLWRRLFAEGAIVWLDHERFWEELSTETGYLSKISRDLTVKTADFQAGLSLLSCYRWSLSNRPVSLACYDLFTYPVAYLRSIEKPSFSTPEEFQNKGTLEKRIDEARTTLPELLDHLDISVNKNHFNECGIKIFFENEQ